MGSDGNGEGNVDKAFNLGSDARVEGLYVTSNPYYPGSAEHIYWIRGWEDVNKHWGQWAKWPIRRLSSLWSDP